MTETDTDDQQATLSPELLRKAGTALFGDGWIAPLAYDQAVSVRAMERWAAGTLDPPPGLAAEVVALCQHRAEMFRTLAATYATRATAIDDAAKAIARHVAKLASV